MSNTERYLARLGFSGEIQPNRATLEELLRLHVATIPFENATSFAWGPSSMGAVSQAAEAVVEKMLGAVDGGPRRGGYCLEHARLLRTVLPGLGFTTRPALGRVYADPEHAPTAKTHAVVVVRLDDRDLLVDPGFGGLTPTAPLDLGNLHSVQATPHGDYRVLPIAAAGVDRTSAPDVDVMVQTRLDTPEGPQWKSIYALDLDAVAEIDLPALNWFISTSPESVFTRTFAVALAPEHQRLTLGGSSVRQRTIIEVTKQELGTKRDLAIVTARLGVDLQEEHMTAIARRLSLPE